MSNLIEWDYLPAENNLEARYLETQAEHRKAVSVVVHWGIASRELRLKALLDDQNANLHCIISGNTCTCGLRINSGRKLEIADLVISRHHRNPLTLKPDPEPIFRGLVGLRLFSVNSPHPIDLNWDQFVLDYLSKDFKSKLAVPVTWQMRRRVE